MPPFDITLLIVLSFFIIYGLFLGLIRSVGAIAGLVLGVWTAHLAYLPIFGLVDQFSFGHEKAGKIIIFLILFTVVNRLVCFAFELLDRTYDILSIIPFLKTINRILGALLGFFLGVLAIGLILYVATVHLSSSEWIANKLRDSQIAHPLLKFSEFIVPFLSNVISKIKEWDFDFSKFLDYIPYLKTIAKK